ncbi:MAG: hypothetical protein AB7F86_06245 [Bdellovibrionales bacterium]
MTRIVLLFILVSLTIPARAYFQQELMKQKVAKKEASRWTLTDWLSQKRKISLWDQWLAMNRSANFFENNLSAGHGQYTMTTTDASGNKTKDKLDFQSYGLDIFFTIFNLYGEYEKTSDDRESYGGAAGLRLLGTSSQSTNLVARYGWRKLNSMRDGEVWENQFAEGVLDLYVFKYGGLSGKYRNYFSNESNLDGKLGGTRAGGGLFFEYGILRVFGDVFQEKLEIDRAGVKTKLDREGYLAGLKLFF